MQRRPLRVLLIEDSPDDAELILFELRMAFSGVVSERVDTRAGMHAAMRGRRWDLVISDFNLPRFGAHDALAVLRKSGVDIPFIVVSGCIGEERAVALMKEGVSDFVMKNRLARLVPAIERELREASLRREHRQTQRALHESEKLRRGITTSLGEGILVLSDAGRLLLMNPEAERLLGWTEGELFYREVHPIIHSLSPGGEPLPEHRCGILGVLRNGGVYRTEDEVLWRKDGSSMPVSLVVSAIVENGKAIALVVAFQDISRRKQAERELLESRKQLRELSSYLQTVREEERTRIARELHDELGQMLTGVKLDAVWLASRLPDGQPAMAAKIASMSKLIDETLDAMRRVAADLRPVMLDDLGLAAAVEWLVEDFGERTGIGVRLEVDMGGDGQCNCQDVGLDAEVSTAAFRIVQECLTNAARHAQAEQVLVSLECCNGRLMLMVSDNGKGMDMAGGNECNSLGIIGMRERAHGVGGTFHLFGALGGGVTVVAVIPVKPVESRGAAE